MYPFDWTSETTLLWLNKWVPNTVKELPSWETNSCFVNQEIPMYYETWELIMIFRCVYTYTEFRDM